jgi:hypothetical protein
MAFSATPLRKIDYPTDNYVINGDMYFSQRGTYTTATSSTNGAYHLDRWAEYIATVSATIQQLTAVSVSASTKAVRMVPSSTGAGNIGIRHNFEMDPRWLGNPVVFSALLRSNSAYSRLLVQTDQGNFYSTPHSGSGDWELLVVRPAFTSTIDRAGCILGGASFGNPSINATMYMDMTNATFNMGSDPQEFMPFGGNRINELAACQRYYENSFSGGATYFQAHYMKAATTVFLVGNVLYKVPKRIATPAPSIISVLGTAGKVSRFPDNVDIGGTVTAGFYSTTGVTLLQDSGTAFVANTDYSFHWAVSAEY